MSCDAFISDTQTYLFNLDWPTILQLLYYLGAGTLIFTALMLTVIGIATRNDAPKVTRETKAEWPE